MSNREKSQTSASNTITDSRGQVILSAIINEHLVTGEPVGSKIVSERFAGVFGMSSANIRNVMSELENSGFVEQPHTSAGRVPTDKGYRFFVDNLLGILSLSKEDLELINRELGLNELDLTETPERLIGRSCRSCKSLFNAGISCAFNDAHLANC